MTLIMSATREWPVCAVPLVRVCNFYLFVYLFIFYSHAERSYFFSRLRWSLPTGFVEEVWLIGRRSQRAILVLAVEGSRVVFQDSVFSLAVAGGGFAVARALDLVGIYDLSCVILLLLLL